MYISHGITSLSWKFSVFEFDEEKEKVEEKSVCEIYQVGVCVCACRGVAG
jgi:hypothetical protein